MKRNLGPICSDGCEMSILERRESIIKVKDLMTKNLVAVEADDNAMNVARLMSQRGVSSVLVKHGGEFIGMSQIVTYLAEWWREDWTREMLGSRK